MSPELHTPQGFLPSFSALRSFECAARRQSFTQAAEELNLTQSAVSRQIKELEHRLGVRLFRRIGRRVQLTDAGRVFAQELTSDLDRLRQTVFRTIAAGETGASIRIAVLPTFASRWLIPRLADFEARHPDIMISMASRLAPFDFSADHFDLALHFGTEEWPDAVMTEVTKERMVPVASPAFGKKYNIKTPSDLAEAPLIHLESRPTAWRAWFRAAGLDDVPALPRRRFDQFSMVTAAAAASLGAALLPAHLIEEEVATGVLAPLSDLPLETDNRYFAVRPKGLENRHVDLFIDWLRHISPQGR